MLLYSQGPGFLETTRILDSAEVQAGGADAEEVVAEPTRVEFPRPVGLTETVALARLEELMRTVELPGPAELVDPKILVELTESLDAADIETAVELTEEAEELTMADDEAAGEAAGAEAS
jgi:hypothetical protein